MANVKTTKRAVLQRVLDRAIEQVEHLNEDTIWVSSDPEPPEASQKAVFVTIVATNGRFEPGLLGGGGENVCGYEGGVAFTLFSRIKTGRYGHDANLLLDENRGLFALEQQILKAFAGHMLTDECGDEMLHEHMMPLTDDDPRRSSLDKPPGSMQLVFSTNFDWDLT